MINNPIRDSFQRRQINADEGARIVWVDTSLSGWEDNPLDGWVPRRQARDLFFNRVPDLLKTGQGSDITIKCGGREWKLHKTILMLNSEYFRKAFTGPFIESTSSYMTLYEVDPDCFDPAVRYLYNEDVDSIFRTEIASAPLKYVLMFEIADHLGIDGFARHAEKLLNHLHNLVRNVHDMVDGLEMDQSQRMHVCLKPVVNNFYRGRLDDLGDSDKPMWLTGVYADVVDERLVVPQGFFAPKDLQLFFEAVDYVVPNHMQLACEEIFLGCFGCGLLLMDEMVLAEIEQRPWLVEILKQRADRGLITGEKALENLFRLE